jgi:hypothetical protein
MHPAPSVGMAPPNVGVILALRRRARAPGQHQQSQSDDPVAHRVPSFLLGATIAGFGRLEVSGAPTLHGGQARQPVNRLRPVVQPQLPEVGGCKRQPRDILHPAGGIRSAMPAMSVPPQLLGASALGKAR